jgi:hypothetical protein
MYALFSIEQSFFNSLDVTSRIASYLQCPYTKTSTLGNVATIPERSEKIFADVLREETKS